MSYESRKPGYSVDIAKRLHLAQRSQPAEALRAYRENFPFPDPRKTKAEAECPQR